MDNQQKYVNLINKIFECTEVLKKGYNNMDNINHITEIEEYNKSIVEALNQFKKEEKESDTV